MSDKNKIKQVLTIAKKDPVFFAETFLIGEDGKPIRLEEHQKRFLRDKSQYKIFFCSRRSGKSVSFAIDMLHKSFFRKNQSIVAVLPTQEQSKELARVFGDFVIRSPMLPSSFQLDNRFEKQLANGSRVLFATGGTKSGKKQDSSLVGKSIHTLYLDEAQSLDEDSLATIIPIMSGQSGRQELILSGTPRGNANFLSKQMENAKTLLDYPKTDKEIINQNGKFSLHRFQMTDVDEEGNVLYSNAPHRLSIQELEDIKTIIGLKAFQQEYCLDFGDDYSVVYYDKLIEEAGICQEPPIFRTNDICVGGIDFGKTRNHSVLAIASFNGASFECKYFKSWLLGTPYSEITHYINKILPVYFPKLAILSVDATGVGKAIVEQLDYRNRFHIEDIIFTQQRKIMLAETAVSNLESKIMTFFPHRRLTKEMKEYTRTLTDSEKIVFEKGGSDDFVDAFNLCNLSATMLLQSNPRILAPPTQSLTASLGKKSLYNTPNPSGIREKRLNRKIRRR